VRRNFQTVSGIGILGSSLPEMATWHMHWPLYPFILALVSYLHRRG
jgi:hypothetical protein